MIRTTIFGIRVLVQWRIKVLGGITIVIHPISTDSIVVDLIIVTPTGSTGSYLEAYIIPWNVLRWSWGPNIDRQPLDFFFHLNVILIFFSCLKINLSSGKNETNLLWFILQSACLFFCATAVRWRPFSRLIALSLVNICCSHCSLQLGQRYFFTVNFFSFVLFISRI